MRRSIRGFYRCGRHLVIEIVRPLELNGHLHGNRFGTIEIITLEIPVVAISHVDYGFGLSTRNCARKSASPSSARRTKSTNSAMDLR
jgi:hypothetical protein